MLWNYSELDATKLSRVQAAESELGITLLALNPDRLSAAEINDAQVKRLREYEKELGLVLVAIDTSK